MGNLTPIALSWFSSIGLPRGSYVLQSSSSSSSSIASSQSSSSSSGDSRRIGTFVFGGLKWMVGLSLVKKATLLRLIGTSWPAVTCSTHLVLPQSSSSLSSSSIGQYSRLFSQTSQSRIRTVPEGLSFIVLRLQCITHLITSHGSLLVFLSVWAEVSVHV